MAKNDPRDFKKLNKMSLHMNATTAQMQNTFRKTHDARIPFGVIDEKVNTLPDDTFAYGRRSKPPTPVNKVISGYYGETASEKL